MERQYRVAYRTESSKVKKLIEVGIIDGVEYVASVNEI